MIKKAVFFLCLLLIPACATQELYTPDPNDVYKNDLKVRINGVDFIGVGVAKASPQYVVEVDPPGEIDRIMWRTCNREEVVDAPKTGWNGRYKFVLNPVQGLEDIISCGLNITVLEEKKRRNAFAFIEFEDRRPEVSLVGQIACNGVTANYKGVSVCQSAEGLYQQISFGAPVVQRGASPSCDVMVPLNGDEKTYRFKMPKGDCTYYFVAQTKHANGKRYVHRLSTKGYTDVPPIKL